MMYPRLAAVVLAASPNPSPRPSAPSHSVPAHSNINWGDFPTWLAVFVAAVGGTAALIQLRQQSNVLKGEVERNKRRDELIDGQLHELRERAQDRARNQAEGIKIDLEGLPDGPYKVKIRNLSDRPVTDVVAGIIVEPYDGGDTQTWWAFEWHTIGSRAQLGGDLPERTGGSTIPVLKPEDMAQSTLNGSGKNPLLVARFNDDAGRRWKLDHHMHLEPAPDDGWRPPR
jgi:hypothetical protein